MIWLAAKAVGVLAVTGQPKIASFSLLFCVLIQIFKWGHPLRGTRGSDNRGTADKTKTFRSYIGPLLPISARLSSFSPRILMI